MTQSFIRPADRYSPLYFLASVGAGGLTVTFFMYLMFWVPHPQQPVPVFANIAAAFLTGDLATKAMILTAWIGIAVFVVLNLKLLFWNISSFKSFRASEQWATFVSSNAHSQILAYPLALAMTVNGLFIAGMAFVPGLWTIVEYLFPLALIAFLAIGVMAFKMLGGFLGRALTVGDFKCEANNSFAQMLPAFALAMIGVGLSAPTALSSSATVVGIAMVLSTFFLMAASLIALIAMILGLRSMMEHGANPESAPTLMVVIPLLTVLGVLMLRQSHGMHLFFENHATAGNTFILLTRLLSVQLLFALFGILILGRQNYAQRFINGTEASAGSYALICPGVALNVMLNFWVHKGLVATNLIAKYSVAYWGFIGIAIALQIAMIVLIVRLHYKHFGRGQHPNAVAAQ